MGYSSVETQILAQCVLNLDVDEPSVLWSKLSAIPQSRQHTSVAPVDVRGCLWPLWILAS